MISLLKVFTKESIDSLGSSMREQRTFFQGSRISVNSLFNIANVNIPSNVRDQILPPVTKLGQVLWEAMLEDKIEMANAFETTDHIDQKKFLPTTMILSKMTVIRDGGHQGSIYIAGDICNFRL